MVELVLFLFFIMDNVADGVVADGALPVPTAARFNGFIAVVVVAVRALLSRFLRALTRFGGGGGPAMTAGREGGSGGSTRCCGGGCGAVPLLDAAAAAAAPLLLLLP